MTEIEEVRTAIGANEGESTIDALHRYTFAVQLGCALKLERHADKAVGDTSKPMGPMFSIAVAATKDAAALLRHGIPEGLREQPDAIARWKAEQVQAIKEGWLEVVFERAWQELLGDIPSALAKARFRQLLEEYEPGDGPTRGPSREPECPSFDSPDYSPEADEIDSGDADGDDSTR